VHIRQELCHLSLNPQPLGIFCFWERVSLCLGWPWTHNLPAFTSWVAEYRCVVPCLTFFCFFETGSHYVAQASLELMTFLTQSLNIDTQNQGHFQDLSL
jgi:hypothetical protein